MITLNGPEATGFEFVKFATSPTFAQMCFGTTNTRFTVAAMNWESGVFSRMTTVYFPRAVTEAMLLPAPVRPTRSMSLSCRPAVML